MLTISVLHKIFLTKEERYALHQGHAVRVMGISVPTWFIGDKTSDPSQEIFCEYTIVNNKAGSRPVTPAAKGYTIFLPQTHETMPKVVNPFQGTASEERVRPPTSFNLLDMKDGGCESINFKQYTRLKLKGELVNLLHFVDIEDTSVLDKTITDNS